MDAMLDDTTHGTIPVSTSQEESGLCERCRALEIGTYLESSDCRFCKQFHKLLSTTEQSASLAENTKIKLSRGPISTSDNKDGCHNCCISASCDFVLGSVTRAIRTSILYPRPFFNFLTPNIANYDMVKQSLLYCEENHLDGCQPLSPPSSILQLIDCKARKIIPALEGQRYICLSYVWGPNAGGEQNVPLELPSNIPKTIEDAMYVAIEIGIPFLWVDRYCINQTNVQQKHTVIQNMDKIYSGANLTIISAAGEDPHHGLPGVRGTPRQSQFQLGGEFCTYFGVLSPAAEVANSKWGSRGWTYQEMLLSRRRLLFTSSQRYFQCTLKFELESLQTTLPMAVKHAAIHEFYYRAFPIGVVCDDYSGLLERLCEYYKRHLSFSKDIIDAFVGIINAFDCPRIVGGELVGHTTATHFYGIPIIRPEYVPGLAQHTFLRSLGYIVGRNGTPMPSSQKESTCMFPSWTWASIKANEAPERRTYIFYPRDDLKDVNSFPDQEVNVMLWDRHKGAVSLSSFANSVDVYTDLQPWLDITTWARSYTVTQPDTADVRVSFDRDTAEHAVQDLAKFEFFLLCLFTKAYLMNRDEDLWVYSHGLLVVGTGQKTYRRVGTYSGDVELELASIPEEIQRRVVLERATPPTRPSPSSRGRLLKIDSWYGPRAMAAWPQSNGSSCRLGATDYASGLKEIILKVAPTKYLVKLKGTISSL